MRHFTSDRLVELLHAHEPPCVSLYQPTHRHRPERDQDPIRFRNLVRDVEAALRHGFDEADAERLLERLRALEHDKGFWTHRTEGLALLASPERLEIVDVQQPLVERVVVSDSFHVKPLLRVLQSADRFCVLALSRREARLFEGNRYTLDPVELDGVPLTLTEALGEDRTEPHLTVASYGMKGSAAGDRAMHHGHGDRGEEVDIDTERFFRHVDRAVLEHVSKPTQLPLLLAALPEHHTPFRALSRNPFLLQAGVEGNPEAFDVEALREKAWRALEPRYLERLETLLERYGSARARGLGSSDVEAIGRAAVEGRVDVLLVAAERDVPGRLGASSGQPEPGSALRQDADDLLDDLAEAVLRTKGEVVVVPAERLPSESGALAIYRY